MSQVKAGRIRMFKYDENGKTTFKLHLDLEDGRKIEGKIFPNVGANDQIYYGGNVYFVDVGLTSQNKPDTF
jgi:hypothetical protein